MNQETKHQDIKNWDRVTIWLLSVSIILILFSFFTPYLFTKTTSNSNLDFSNTGQIGDTIGGIMNPFIALVGVLITFLAFYMQIKANRIQIKIFKDSLDLDKRKDSIKEEKENLTRLKIVKALLSSILKFYATSGRQLKEFIDKEKEFPLEPNLYYSSNSSAYQNFLKLDLLESYKALVFYFKDKDIDWEENFIKVLDLLNFYDEMFKELKIKYQNHITKKVELLHSQGENLNTTVNNMLSDPIIKDFEEMDAYFGLLAEGASTGTDFIKLRNEFIIPLIKKLLQYRNEDKSYVYKNFLDSISSINKKLGGEVFQSKNYVQNLEDTFNANLKDNDAGIKKIKEFMDLIDV